MRFLHTADWQVGMKAVHAGAAACQVREERLAAGRRVVHKAREAGADFLLLAGDTFEDNGVERVLIQRVADLLGSFGGPVYVLPGNHDPLAPGSVWEHPAWRSWPQINVLREEAPVPVPGGVLYPCPVRERDSGQDPTAWISAADASAIRIGVAHGTVAGVAVEEAGYPIPREAAARAGLDYLALGHWHSMSIFPSKDGLPRMAYAGSPESTRFGERDSGNVLLVEISAPGAPPALKPLRTGRLVWMVLEEQLREAGDLARVRRQIEAVPDPGSTLLEVRCNGLLATADRPELARLEELLAARFLMGRLEASRLRPSPADAGWLAGLPDGAVREAAARLRDWADPAFGGRRPEDVTPEAASRALLELFALAAEVGP